jgi:hypothetical protein
MGPYRRQFSVVQAAISKTSPLASKPCFAARCWASHDAKLHCLAQYNPLHCLKSARPLTSIVMKNGLMGLAVAALPRAF